MCFTFVPKTLFWVIAEKKKKKSINVLGFNVTWGNDLLQVGLLKILSLLTAEDLQQRKASFGSPCLLKNFLPAVKITVEGAACYNNGSFVFIIAFKVSISKLWRIICE